MGRPSGKHIDSEELGILFPWATESDQGEVPRTSVERVREVHRHLQECSDCRNKLLAYRQIVSRLSNVTNSAMAPAGAGCPENVAWIEVVAGLWPELKGQQLIRHAALCDHCGPLLRHASRQLKKTQPKESATEIKASVTPLITQRGQFLAWLIPLCCAAVILAVLIGIPLSSRTVLSAPRYAEFAVRTHMAFKQGALTLAVQSDSEQAVNDWLKQNAQFQVRLPATPGAQNDHRPYQLKGASLVQVGAKRAAFIAYQMDSGPASLMIAPYAVAVASGGVEARFKKVTFHYRTVEGLKVVTWSQHGLTYALVSQEGPATQKSCMVCHSAMRDRDLTNTPTPLNVEGKSVRFYLQ